MSFDFFPSYFKWTYGNPAAGPSAKLPRHAFLFLREQVRNSSFRELPRSRFFNDFSRSASAVTRGASAKVFSRGCVQVCYCMLLCICWWAGHSDNVFGCTGWRVLPPRLSVPPRERFASAKLPRSFRKEYEHFYQELRSLPPCVYHGSCKTITS